ncbi:MAG: septum formation protein Maf [Spirochaetes bacterium]|nr:MAG: septum formation protein Maf [Spirochaetota bacterium]
MEKQVAVLKGPPKLYLYSASPRRGELLRRIGIDFIPFPVVADESIPGDRSSDEIVSIIAKRKLEAGIQAHPSHGDYWGLAADTLVQGPEGLMGKPETAEDAASMLQLLSGITHRVYTGIAVYSPEKEAEIQIRSISHATTVEFRKLSEKDIKNYILTGEWKGVAGAYRIQERGATLVDRINGLWSTVVGLPLSPLYGILTAMSYPFG